MEGIGSRTGRPSSRYGSAPVFTGPVRRWQKQWVHVSSSSSSSLTYKHNDINTSNSNNNNNASAIRIRRWTPVPTTQETGDSESVPEERPKRKLRYAPIVVLEGKKKEIGKGDADVKETSKTNQYTAQAMSENDDDDDDDDDEIKTIGSVDATKPKASEKSAATSKDLNQPIDMDTTRDEDHDLGGSNQVADWVKAAQRGFAH